MREIKESDIEAMLGTMVDNLPELEPNLLKDMLCGLTERITIDPKHQLVVLIINQAEFAGIGGVPKGIRTPVLTVKG